jgi:hypothetical protein
LSVPTLWGVFDPEFVEQLVDVVVAFGGVGGHCVFWIAVEGEDNGASACTIPGRTVPRDPRTVRSIRADTRVLFTALRVRRPGIHRETRPVSDKIRR